MDDPDQPHSRPTHVTAKHRAGHGAHERPHAPVRKAPVSASFASAWEHPRVLVCLLLTLLALPVLALSAHRNGADRSGFQVQTAAAEGNHATSTVPSRAATTSSPASTTTAPPTTSAPTTAPATTAPPETAPATTQPAWTPPPTTAPAWTPPPTTAPPAPTTTAPPAAGAHSESGQATYYGHNASGCASRTVPRGTTVRVTAASGASITCTVDDYGPFGAGRIIDLSEQGFSRLASLSTGVISVTVTW